MIAGSIVALVTPMTIQGDIDWPCLGRLIEWHIEAGTTGIVPVGTTGESATVNFGEHCRVVEFTVDAVAGRIPVIAGTGANSTAEAIELTRAAKNAGVDACLLVTPYYNKPTQEGLFRHHEAIAKAVDVAQLLYNVPGRTACDMLPETVARISKIDLVIGIKEATGSLERSRDIRTLCGDDFLIFSGDDETACDLILQGANGAISVTANIAPAENSAMCAAALAGDEATAHRLDELLQGLHKNLFLESNPIPVKWALQEMGLIGPGIRLPLTPFAEKFHEDLRQSMRQAGALT